MTILQKISPSATKLKINTGNILNLKEIKQLTGHNQSDELVESLKITLSSVSELGDELNTDSDSVELVRRGSSVCSVSETDGAKDDLKISVKIFLLAAKADVLKAALDKVLHSLEITRIDSLVLACKLDPSSVLSSLQELWSVVEELAGKQVLVDVGVSDIDTDVFIALHNWAKVKPRIIQINLAVCCVVPPILQEFCKANNVQLLTHSDPLDILPRAALREVFACSDSDSLALEWVVRYLQHIQARGVLHSKGYLVSVGRAKTAT